MPSNAVYACVTCRVANKGGACGRGHEMRYMGARWRAPRKNDKKAWQRVADGDLLWDDRAVARKANLKQRKHERAMERWREYCEKKKLDRDRAV